MKNFTLFLLFLSIYCLAPAQLLLEENFNYPVGDSLVLHGWTPHSGRNSNPLTVTSPGLSYPHYVSSNIGNAVTIIGGIGSREDAHKTFTSQTEGNVYVYFLVNVLDASIDTTDYFLHLGPSTIGTTFRARVFVKKNSENMLAFGLSKGSATAVFTDFAFELNKTYLLVLCYSFVPGTNNDEVKLWVNPNLFAGEYSPHLFHTDPTTSDLSNVGSIALRQGAISQSVIVDGIRITTSWERGVNSLPTRVHLLTPPNDTVFLMINPQDYIKYSWTTSTDADSDVIYYRVHWYKDSTLNNYLGWTSSGNYGVDTFLLIEKYLFLELYYAFNSIDTITTYWLVTAYDYIDTIRSHEVFKTTFIFYPPSNFRLLEPSNDALFVLNNPNNLIQTKWTGSIDPLGEPITYYFLPSLDSSFHQYSVLDSLLSDKNGRDTTFTFEEKRVASLMNNLGVDTLTIYWKVLAFDGWFYIPSENKFKMTFVYKNLPPTDFSSIEPEHNSVVYVGNHPGQNSLLCRWQSSIDPEQSGNVDYIILFTSDSSYSFQQPMIYSPNLINDSLIYIYDTTLTIDTYELKRFFDYFQSSDSVDVFYWIVARDIWEKQTFSSNINRIRLIKKEFINNPPTSFNLLSPQDGELIILTKPDSMHKVVWQKAKDPDGDIVKYYFIPSLDPLFNAIIDTIESDNSGIDTTFTFYERDPANLFQILGKDTIDIFWKVIATDDIFFVESNQVFKITFILKNNSPGIFTLIYPQPNVQILVAQDTGLIYQKFEWTKSVDIDENDIVGYALLFSSDSLMTIYNAWYSPNFTGNGYQLTYDTVITIDTYPLTIMINYPFVDTSMIFYKVAAMDKWGYVRYSTDVFKIKLKKIIVDVKVKNELPKHYVLYQNYPNPFNSTTSIKFSIPEEVNIKLEIYNILGQRVRTLISDKLYQAGFWEIHWNGKDNQGNYLESGIYFYKLSAGKYSETKKMVLMK